MMPGTLNAINTELASATAKFPGWPLDPIHAAAIVNEECGELQKAVLEWTYEPWKSGIDEARNEAIQTAAMAIRFIDNLDRYQVRPDPAHPVDRSA